MSGRCCAGLREQTLRVDQRCGPRTDPRPSGNPRRTLRKSASSSSTATSMRSVAPPTESLMLIPPPSPVPPPAGRLPAPPRRFATIGGGDRPAVLRHDAVRHRQPQARPARVQPRRHECVEDLRQHLGAECRGRCLPRVTETASCAPSFVRRDATQISPQPAGTANSALRSRLTKTCISLSALPITRCLRVGIRFTKPTADRLLVDRHQVPGLLDQGAQPRPQPSPAGARARTRAAPR